MPQVIWDLIFKLAVQFGIPYLIAKVPWLAKLISPELMKIIEDFIKNMTTVKERKAEVKAAAIRKAKKCVGSSCVPELKKDR